MNTNLKCPYCHENVGQNQKFCTNCGRKLFLENLDPKIENVIYTQNLNEKILGLEKPELKSPSNKKKKILWSIGATICIFLLIIGTSFSFLKKNGDVEALNIIKNQVFDQKLIYGNRPLYEKEKSNNSRFIDLYNSHSFSKEIKNYIKMYEDGCELQMLFLDSHSYQNNPDWVKGEELKLEATLNLSAMDKVSLNSQEIKPALFSYFYCQNLYLVLNGEKALIEEHTGGVLKQVFHVVNKTGYDIEEIEFIYRINGEEKKKTIFDFGNDTEEKIEFELPSSMDPQSGEAISYAFYPGDIKIKKN